MPTVAELAADLELSPAAVSRILNGKGSFPASTRDRVIRRAAELGFRPNAMARAVRLQRFSVVSLLTIAPTWKGDLPPLQLAGAIDAATARGSQVMVARGDDRGLEETAVLRQRCCDGFLVNYHLDPPAAVRQAIAGCQVPAVWMNVRLPSACAYPDDLQAGLRLGRRLISMGHRRLAYLDCHHPQTAGCHYSAADRRTGLAEACREAGLTLRLHVPPQRMEEPNDQLAFVRALLAGPERPDAVATYAEHDALRVLLAAAALGLRIPEDLSLAMFHHQPDVGGMTVDAMLLPLAELGRRSADLLLDAVDGGGTTPALAIPFGESLGRTCRDRT